MRRGILVLVVLVPVLLPLSGLTAADGDGRVGAIVDLQGTVVVRSSGRERWTPANARTVLWPGDMIKVLPRGANAAEVALTDGGTFVLGPGAMAEVPSGGALRVLRGEAEVTGREGAAVELTAAGGFEAVARGVTLLRAEAERTVLLDGPPRWLEGYRKSTSAEWLGSLIAQVDGRSVPLDIGFHQVSAVIRDQIAETTVTESFVNNTGSTLEGVFTFPLPAGASVSGFGMWIGDELVMADVVERQRAREIYEDIKARKKDPGLLEWSGGNLFKASVFPIPPHGEKRIRIRYTQVLPLEGRTGTVRYRYPLRSEMLRHHPLRKLNITVSAESTIPFASATSPTHEVSVEKSAHHARVQFDAEEYIPERDFEAAFNLQSVPNLSLSAHRRGEDGYFMLLLTAGAPGTAAAKTTSPVDLLLLADTSGSMSRNDRRAQEEFIATLLALLGPNDRFRLAAIDHGLAWIAQERQSPDAAESALEKLAARASLGWTDLEGALGEAPTTGPSHIVYLGDGIGTKEGPDAGKLAARIRRLTVPGGTVCHALSTGSSYEQGVLSAIASLGGGSVRAVGDTPADTAAEFLNEITSETISELTVSIEGLRTARVYPRRLPRLPAGSQQAILGRFLPTGGSTEGTVVVRGSLAGKPVEFRSPFVMPQDDAGNTFLPRLWARRHLEALIGDGINAANRSEIVTFSRRFGIITPLTSFLVLENDEDREFYGVKRMVGMRDGERFFAESRDRTRAEARRTQMRAAEEWRQGLKDQMIAEIRHLVHARSRMAGPQFEFGIDGGGSGFHALNYAQASELAANQRLDFDGDGGFFGMAEEGDALMPPRLPVDAPDFPAPPGTPFMGGGPFPSGGTYRGRAYSGPAGEVSSRRSSFGYFDQEVDFGRGRTGDWILVDEFAASHYSSVNLLSRFPYLPPAMPMAAEKPQPDWPEEALALLKGLARRIVAAEIGAGLEVVYRNESYAVPGGEIESLQRARTLLAPGTWYTYRSNRSSAPISEWMADGRRGSLNTATGLGRRRKAVEIDRKRPLGFMGLITENPGTYSGWSASVARGRKGIAILRLTPQQGGNQSVEYFIDPVRNVVIERRWFTGEKLSSCTRYSGFTEALGHLWPTTISHEDGEGGLTGKITVTIATHEPARVSEEIAKILAAHGDAVFLPAEDPTLLEARQAAFEGRAGLPERLILLSHHLGLQRHTRAAQEWEAIAEMISGKWGARWLHLDLLYEGRRGEELRALLDDLAGKIGRFPYFEAQFLALDLRNKAWPLSPEEELRLAEALSPVWSRDGEDADVWRPNWSTHRAILLFEVRRPVPARAAYRELLEEYPDSRRVLLPALRSMADADDRESFMEFARRALGASGGWADRWRNDLTYLLEQRLWAWEMTEEYLEVARAAVRFRPEDQRSYERLLVGLLSLDRHDEAREFLIGTLQDGVPAKDDQIARARFQAVINYLGGQIYRVNQSYLEREYEPLLAKLTRELLACVDDRAQLGEQLLRSGAFAETAAGREISREVRRAITSVDAVRELSFPQLSAYENIWEWRPNELDRDTWVAVAAALLPRWRTEENLSARETILHWLLRIFEHTEDPDAAIRLIEEDLGRAGKEKSWIARDLAERIASGPWSKGREDRLFDLLPVMFHGYLTEEHLPAEAESITAWTVSRLHRMRLTDAFGTDEVRKLFTRTELRRHDADARLRVRRELAARLDAAAKTIDEVFRPWFQIEGLALLAETGDADARDLLLLVQTEEKDHATRSLVRRSLALLDRLAIRDDATPALVESVIGLHRERATKREGRFGLFRLLVALDRIEEVEALLLEWIEPGQVYSRWRVALGFMLARKGDLPGAISQFEEVDALEELGPGGLKMLEDWQFVLGQDEKRRSMQQRRIGSVPVDQLGHLLEREYARLDPDQNGGEASTLSPEALVVARELMLRAPMPSTHLSGILGLYRLTKDIRVLESLPLGVTGHSPEAIYNLLYTLSSDAVEGIHEEATLDGMREQILLAFPSARTDTDRRALRLFLALIEGRAANVIDESKPHARVSVQALQAAFPGGFEPGERRLLAELLWFLDSGEDEALDQERLRQLRALLAGEDDPAERFAIAYDLARVEWECKEMDRAINTLTSILPEYGKHCGGALPREAREVISSLRTWLSSIGQFRHAEDILTAELGRQGTPRARDWYRFELLELACAAFDAQGELHDVLGELRTGTGKSLYAATREGLERAMLTLPPTKTKETLALYLRLIKAGKEQEVESAADDLVRFSSEVLPTVLVRIRDTGARHHRIFAVAEALRETVSPLVEVTFLITRLEAEPEWYRAANRKAWPSLGRRLAKRYPKVKLPPGLEDRLFALVLREMRRDLTSPSQGYRYLYGYKQPGFWKAKAEEFAIQARAIIEEHRGDPDVVLRASSYLYYHLNLKNEGIETLLAAEGRGTITDNGRLTLTDWLHRAKRYEEALEHARVLHTVDKSNRDHRRMMIVCLDAVGEKSEADAYATETIEWFKREGLWNTNAQRDFGGVLLRLGYFARSEEIYREMISVYLEAPQHRRRRYLDQQSEAWTGLARSLAGLGRTDEAIEAAANAVVAWGRNKRGRDRALRGLKAVFKQVKDLDTWVANHEAQVAKTGQDAPLLRLAAGTAYLARKQPVQAVEQLRIARRLSPEDKSIHRTFLQAARKTRKKELIEEALLEHIAAFPRELPLYEKLGEHYDKSGHQEEAERARTTKAEFK